MTSIEAMKKLAGPVEVNLSGWDENEITVKLRKPSLYEMAASGRIPNPLLGTADAIFTANGAAISKAPMDEQYKVIRMVARAAMAEPTAEELDEAGIVLTDQQINEIYVFVIGGAAKLDTFRGIQRSAAGGHGAADGMQSVEPDGH